MLHMINFLKMFSQIVINTGGQKQTFLCYNFFFSKMLLFELVPSYHAIGLGACWPTTVS